MTIKKYRQTITTQGFWEKMYPTDNEVRTLPLIFIFAGLFIVVSLFISLGRLIASVLIAFLILCLEVDSQSNPKKG